jgi:hypothetical protein
VDPPPLSYDKRIEGLKRIEIRIPGYMLEKEKINTLPVELELKQ